MSGRRHLFAPGSLARRVAIRGGLLALGITVALWAAVLLQQARHAQALLEHEARRAEALARSTAELTQRVLAVADRALANAGRLIDAGENPQAAVDAALAHTGLDGEIITTLRFLDAQGRPLGERVTRPALRATPEHFADREYFRVHVAPAKVGLHLGRTVHERQSGARAFEMSRRLDHVDGRLRGVLQVGLDAAWLASLLQHVGREMGFSLTLVGEDGAIRVRVSTDGEPGFDQVLSAGHPLLPLLRSGRVSAPLDQPSRIESGTRLLVLRRLQGFPLAIVVGEREDAMDARAAPARRVALSLLGVVTVLLWSGFFAAITLVGRIEHARHALRGALVRARSASRAKSAFLGSLSHELRTPLTGILGYASLIERRSPDAQAREAAATLRGSAQRLGALLDEMLDAARAESGARSVTLAPEPIREIVREACALFAPAAQARGVALACHVDDAVPDEIDCDAMRMRQVLNILLSDAVAAARSGTIAVRMRIDDPVAGPAPAIDAISARPATAAHRTAGPWLRIDVAVATGHAPGPGPSGPRAVRAAAPAGEPPDTPAPERALAVEFMRRMGGALTIAGDARDGSTATAWLPLPRPPASAHLRAERTGTVAEAA